MAGASAGGGTETAVVVEMEMIVVWLLWLVVVRRGKGRCVLAG